MNFYDIVTEDVQLRCLSIVAQRWRNNDGFSVFKDEPRYTNALILVCSKDITMTLTEIDREPITLECGDLVLVPKGTKYVMSLSKDPDSVKRFDSYTMNFNVSDLSGNDIMLSENITVLAKDSFSQIESVMSELSRVCNDINVNNLKKQSKLYELFDTIVSCMNDKADDYYPIRRGIRQFNKEWNRNEKISKYASVCAVSEGYFHHLFKEWSGMSPVEYRNSLRIAQAKALLLNNSMSIKDIATYVGFDDQFYFSRVFKSITGVSPQQYKNI